MAYVVLGDFRTATLAEYCEGVDLDSTEAPDAILTATISRASLRFDDLTNDHYESESLVFTIEAPFVSTRLVLPRRCTAVSQVRIQDQSGTWTVQTASVYRLHSSLYATGSRRLGDVDWLELVPFAGGLSGLPSSTIHYPYSWPTDTGSIEITGTFGWTTTPADVKRAVALLVWDSIKNMRGDLQRAESIETATQRVNFASTTPTGIPEADSIIADYIRNVSTVGIG